MEICFDMPIFMRELLYFYEFSKHFNKLYLVLLLGKLRLISVGLLRKVSKGLLCVPSQQSVHVRAKKSIKETASLASQNIFTISTFIKYVKKCDHKAFQGLNPLGF